LGADKGYDSNPLRKDLQERHIAPCIVRRANNRTAVTAVETKQSRYSKQRWKIERSFNWLNNNRRIDRFMEKRTRTYQGFCYMAFIKFYLKKLAR
jgi:IS5 family transposase